MKLALVSLMSFAQLAAAQTRTVFAETPTFTASRTGRFVVIELKTPHLVLSTSGRAGGQTSAVRFLVNHQSGEANGEMNARTANMTREEEHNEVAKDLGLDPAKTATMGTAANMNHMGHRHIELRGIAVDAFVTAGVEGNAARADDPSEWLESEHGWVNVGKGTINTILVINKPLTPGGQARAAITMVEAKSAALAELAVGSLYSPHIATGSGTDQFIIASPLDPTVKPLEWPASSTKLGQMIGEAVLGATLEALRWQNGLDPSATRNVTRALGRFGLSEKELQARLKKAMPEKNYEFLKKNPWAVTMDPAVSAAAFAYAAILDRLQYGTLPEELASDALRSQAAVAATALAGQPGRLSEFWNKISVSPNDRLDPFVQGLALGWQERWAQ